MNFVNIFYFYSFECICVWLCILKIYCQRGLLKSTFYAGSGEQSTKVEMSAELDGMFEASTQA